jgi:hypothetical protein
VVSGVASGCRRSGREWNAESLRILDPSGLSVDGWEGPEGVCKRLLARCLVIRVRALGGSWTN